MSLTGKVTADKLLRGKINGLDVIYTDTYEIAVKNGFEGTIDEWLASLKGDKGDKGEKGDTGATGAQGEQGEPGNSIHALTGQELQELSMSSELVVGDLYIVTEAHPTESNITKGSIWEAKEPFLFSYKGSLIDTQAQQFGFLTDRTTGTNYTLYVDNGKLKMEVAE